MTVGTVSNKQPGSSRSVQNGAIEWGKKSLQLAARTQRYPRGFERCAYVHIAILAKSNCAGFTVRKAKPQRSGWCSQAPSEATNSRFDSPEEAHLPEETWSRRGTVWYGLLSWLRFPPFPAGRWKCSPCALRAVCESWCACAGFRCGFFLRVLCRIRLVAHEAVAGKKRLRAVK